MPLRCPCFFRRTWVIHGCNPVTQARGRDQHSGLWVPCLNPSPRSFKAFLVILLQRQQPHHRCHHCRCANVWSLTACSLFFSPAQSFGTHIQLRFNCSFAMDRIERPTVIPVENETKSSASRVTVEGKTITYRMTVLQQPVRARACGQGAKCSSTSSFPEQAMCTDLATQHRPTAAQLIHHPLLNSKYSRAMMSRT